MSEQQSISDGKRRYFHIMLNLADEQLDPYEYRLLGHYVRVAGAQNMPVMESTAETARRCKMSVGKVVETRRTLERGGWIALHKEGNRVVVQLLDKMPENVARFAGTPPSAPSALPQAVAEEERSPSERQNVHQVSADTEPEKRSPDERERSPHERGGSQGERKRSPGERVLYKELKEPDQEPDQEPAAVANKRYPGSDQGAGGGNAPVAAAAAAESKAGKNSQKDQGKRSGKAQSAQTSTKTPKRAGGNERQASAPSGEPVPLADVLGALAAEAAGVDGVDAGAALRAYAENIGELTPILAQKVRDAVKEYGQEEVLDAISEAVLHNVRRWAYIEAILRRRAGQKTRGKGQSEQVRQAKLEWLREKGVNVPEGTDNETLDDLVLSAAGWDPRILLTLNAAAGR